MKLSIDNSKFAVYDDVLDKNSFDMMWRWVQNQEYQTINSKNWMKVWRLTDGNPIGGNEHSSKNLPFGNPLDLFHGLLVQIVGFHGNLVGKWDEISYRSYIYPRGTKIDWHSDQGYVAAAILYTHPIWSPTWGGELKIAETPKNYEYKNIGGQLDVSWKDDFLNAWGVGQYVLPRPNRLVITPAGVWHAINRVDEDAGDNCRCSIVAFFKN
ncbi:MAG: 2OG-Fe(II) oxygenase [Crenarchaeota archaeon]|nr:MAG: 2OG-Fe(II) oxygenase [Thermoproteota archaeon]